MAEPDTSTTDLGYLTGGARGAVRTGLAMLHSRGLVVVGGPGRLRRTGALPAGVEPLERALFGALYGAMAPREVANQHGVRRALAEQREGLIGLDLLRPAGRRFLLPAVLVAVPPVVVARLVAGDLLGVGNGLVAVLALAGIASWFLPRRTVSGQRLLRAVRQRHPAPAGPHQIRTGPATGERAADPGLLVALYGANALRVTMPVFARDSGLLDGGRWFDFFGGSPLEGSSMPTGAATGHS